MADKSDSSTPPQDLVDELESSFRAYIAKELSKEQEGWSFEWLERMGNMLILIWHNGEIRGQVETKNKGEREQWLEIQKLLRKEISPKNSSQR